MKINTKNSPVVVGVLLTVLAVTMFFLIKQLIVGNAPVAAVTPVVDQHPAEAAPEPVIRIVPHERQRDPFDHPSLHHPVKPGAPEQSPPAAPLAAPGRLRAPMLDSTTGGPSIQAQSISVQPILPSGPPPHAAPGVTAGPAALAPTGVKPAGSDASATEVHDPIKGWRLTATIAGRYPRAVIEGVGAGPYRVGIGERVRTLQVAAIYEHEIVLSDAHHLYTLSLMSAPSASEDIKDNSKDASVETTTSNVRENENGTAKIQP